MAATERLLLTIPEACERLGIGRSLAYTFIARGQLPSITLGRARRIPVSALQEFVERLTAEQGGQ